MRNSEIRITAYVNIKCTQTERILGLLKLFYIQTHTRSQTRRRAYICFRAILPPTNKNAWA